MLSWLIALSVVNWRLASLLHTEQMFDWLRKWMGIEQTDSMDTFTWAYPDNVIGDIFGCFWCLSFWVAGILALVAIPFAKPNVFEWFCLWLGTGTGTIIIEKWIGRSKARW